MQKFDFDNAVSVAVLHMRYFAVWVCGFVNCVKYFDKTRLVCKIVLAIGKNCKVMKFTVTFSSENIHNCSCNVCQIIKWNDPVTFV